MIVRAVFAALLVSIGCTDPATSIRVSIEAPATQSLDGLAVVIESQRTVAPMARELTMLVPDEWAGSPVRLEIEGTSASTVVAIGVTEVVPMRGEEVATHVQLVDLGCPPVCSPGDVRCEGDGTVTCELAHGCPMWSEPQPCTGTTPFCSSGICSETCSDECSAAETTCDGTTSVRICSNTDSDSCLDWTSTPCDSNQRCANAVCGAAYSLTIVRAGTGTGSVTSNLGGINCGTDCAESYAAGIDITLTATPSGGSTFAGWSGGGCTGTAPCTLALAAATSVTATFGGACPGSCTAETIPSTGLMGNLVADQTHMYWLTGSNVMRRNLSTGVVDTFASGTGALLNIVLDGTHVYWWSGPHAISRRAKSGSAAEAVVSGVTGTIEGIALDATYLWWTESAPNLVRRRTKAGGAIQTMWSPAKPPHLITVDATHVYFTTQDTDTDTVHRAPRTGGTAQLLLSTAEVLAFAVDATDLYLRSNGLFSIPKAGGAATTIDDSVNGYSMKIDDTHVVWVDGTSVNVRAKTGGPTSVIPGANTAGYVVLTADSIGWWTGSPASIALAPRCACEP